MKILDKFRRKKKEEEVDLIEHLEKNILNEESKKIWEDVRTKK